MPASFYAPASSTTSPRLYQAPVDPVPLRQASSISPLFLPGSSDHTTPPHGPVTSASVLSNAGLQSQKEIIEAIGQLTAEVRNFTNVLTDICCAIKDQKKYILCLVHERCITCPHNTTALGACSSFTACASISSGSDLGAGAAIPFLCAMLCKTRPNNMANLFKFI